MLYLGTIKVTSRKTIRSFGQSEKFDILLNITTSYFKLTRSFFSKALDAPVPETIFKKGMPKGHFIIRIPK